MLSRPVLVGSCRRGLRTMYGVIGTMEWKAVDQAWRLGKRRSVSDVETRQKRTLDGEVDQGEKYNLQRCSVRPWARKITPNTPLRQGNTPQDGAGQGRGRSLERICRRADPAFWAARGGPGNQTLATNGKAVEGSVGEPRIGVFCFVRFDGRFDAGKRARVPLLSFRSCLDVLLSSLPRSPLNPLIPAC